MMSEMIDRGAEAMRAKRRELITQPLDRIWPDLMRAAIEAMREPTEAMAEAIWAETGDPCWKENAIEAWKAGIQVALTSPNTASPARSASAASSEQGAEG